MQWLHRVLRVIGIIAIVAALGFVLYAGGRLMLRHWGAILLAVYTAGALVLLTAGVVVRMRMSRAGNFDDRLLALIGEIATRQQSPLMRARFAIFTVLRAICTVMTWPATLVVSAQRSIQSKGAVNARTAMNLSQLGADALTVEPLAMLVAVVLTTGALAVTVQQRWYALVFCAVAAAYVTLLCSEVTVSPMSLAVRLRRASGNPYRNALLLAAVTAAILTVAYANLHARGFPSTDDVVAAVAGLYSQLDSVKRIFNGQNVSGLDLAQGISGALLASAVIQGLLSLREFQRTDDDLVALAYTKLSLGRAAEALDALRPIQNPSAASLTVQATALVGVNQTLRAIQAWQHRSALPGGPTATGDEQVASTLFQSAIMFPLSSSAFLALLKHWVQLKPQEKALCTVLAQLSTLERVKLDELIAELQQLDPSNATYPVAAAGLCLLKQNLQQAAALAAHAPQTDDVLEYTRLTTLLLAGVLGTTTADEDRQTLEAWCDHNLGRLTDIAAKLDDVGEIGVALSAVGAVEHLATMLQSSHLEAIRFLASTLVARMKSVAPDKDAAQVALNYTLQPRLANPHL